MAKTEPAPDASTARKLFDARKAAKLTQDQLAAQLGLTRVQVGRIEKGTRGTGYDVVERWMQICGSAADTLAIGHGARTGELAAALERITDRDLDLVVRLMRVLPKVDVVQRNMLTLIVEAHEPHP